MDETMTGVFKCRCCGAEIKEKTRFCVCDLIGWKIEEGDNGPHMDT